MVSLYSYLLTEKAVREPAKKYLLIATLTESTKGNNQLGGYQTGHLDKN